jgi:hypothetical protein
MTDFSPTYMLLSRLMRDCEYYLGAGCRYKNHLWALDEEAQIKKMRELYSQLPVKPDWLTLEQIEQYAAQMLPEPATIDCMASDSKIHGLTP